MAARRAATSKKKGGPSGRDLQKKGRPVGPPFESKPEPAYSKSISMPKRISYSERFSRTVSIERSLNSSKTY